MYRQSVVFVSLNSSIYRRENSGAYGVNLYLNQLVALRIVQFNTTDTMCGCKYRVCFVDRRYFVVSGAILVQAITIGCVFAYGVFFNVLETEFGWSRTLLSIATSLAFLNMGVAAIAAGRLTDRFGPRGVLMFTAVTTGIAYVLMYFLSAPWQLIVIYGLLVGLGLATHDVVTLSTIARCFPRRRGMMSGIVKVGAACGQMSVPLIAVMMIAAFGWRYAFVVMGVVAAAILLVAAWLMGIKPSVSKAREAGIESFIAGANTSAGTNDIKKGSTGKSVPESGFEQAKFDTQFWLLCAIQFFFFGTLITIPTHIVPHSIDNGLTPASAATVLSTIAASSIAGRLLVGGFVDRIGGKRCFNICLLLLFLSVVSLLFIENNGFLYLFAVAYGFAHGGLFTVISPTVAEYFGMRAHGAIFGVIVFTGTIGGSMLPILTGLIFDKFQSYQWAFILLASMVLVSLLLSLRLTPHRLNTAD